MIFKTRFNLITFLKEKFADCDDIVFQPIHIEKFEGFLIYLSEFVNNKVMIEIEQGLLSFPTEDTKKISDGTITSFLQSRFPFSQMVVSNEKEEIVDQILKGHTVLMLQGVNDVFLIQASSLITRAIKEPPSEQVVRGPREGFIEDIDTNLMLIRNKLKNAALKVKYITLGVQTKTKIAIVYLHDVANEDIVKEVQRRVSKIDIDGVLESRYIEEMIQDAPFTQFPTIDSTERPDKVCAGLLEGKVAILTGGTPFVLTAPAIFVEFLHTSGDYYSTSIGATLTRWTRFLGLFVSLILPAFICAVTTIHQDLLQTPLLLRLVSYHEDLPYPILLEMIFMLVTFELLREAGLRMPKIYGNSSITILGLLIIAQTAIQVGIIGALSAVTIATTALTTFIIPNYSMRQLISFLRFPMLLLGGFFGLMGIIVGLMFILAYLCSLRSFGVPYLSTISPARKEGWKDVFIRAPRWAMETRSSGFEVNNIKRANSNAPKPENSEGNKDE